MADIITTVISTLVAGSILTLIAVYIGGAMERRRAKALRLLDFKRSAYMELSRTLRAAVDHMTNLGHLQSMDLSAEDRIPVNMVHIQTLMYTVGSEEFVLDLDEDLDEMPDDPTPEQQIEFLEALRTRLLMKGGFDFVDTMKDALDKQEALDFIELPASVRGCINEVRTLIQARLQDQTLDGIKKTTEFGELIPTRPWMEWAKEVSEALGRMKAAMKSDIEKTL